MSPKIAFALLLLGCALLGLANADRWNNWNPYGTKRIPVAPGSQGNECNCQCGEAGQGSLIGGGNQGFPGGVGGNGGNGGQGGVGSQGTHGLNGVKAHDYDRYHG